MKILKIFFTLVAALCGTVAMGIFLCLGFMFNPIETVLGFLALVGMVFYFCKKWG